MNRKTLLFATVLLCASVLHTARSQSLLGINKTDGTEKQISLTTLHKLTFSASNLIINSVNGSTEEIPLLAIQKMVFNSSNGITPIKVNSRTLSAYPTPAKQTIWLKNAPEGELSIEIYALTGSRVANHKLSSASQSIDVSHLPAGLYLMKVNQQTLKFTKL